MIILDSLFNDTEELTYDDAVQAGIDISMIKDCKKIRDLAHLDRVSLDETDHRSKLSKHLFDYIEYCGLDKKEFIKQYLCNLQPYMIERRKDQEKVQSYICVIDNLYRVSVYIKVDTKQHEEIIISFHEDNKRGIAKSNTITKIDNRRYVPIFADCICSKVSDKNRYVVKAFFQRGLLVLPLELPAIKCKNVFIIEKRAIDVQFISYCNDYIRDLYTSNLSIDFDRIEVFSVLQQISFTSYGKDTFSSISLLIDSLNIQTDYISKSAADFTLVTFVQNLKLTKDEQKELKNLLDTKYKVSDIKKIDLILTRVKENLALKYNEELDALAIEAHKIYTKIQND